MRLWIALLGLVLVSSCQFPWSVPKAARVIDVKEAFGMLRNDFAWIVDVREKEEIDEGMVQGAKWFPTSKMMTGNLQWEVFLKSLPTDKDILVYCASGGRSEAVAHELKQKGYKATNIGGFDEWIKAGLPTQKGLP